MGNLSREFGLRWKELTVEHIVSKLDKLDRSNYAKQKLILERSIGWDYRKIHQKLYSIYLVAAILLPLCLFVNYVMVNSFGGVVVSPLFSFLFLAQSFVGLRMYLRTEYTESQFPIFLQIFFVPVLVGLFSLGCFVFSPTLLRNPEYWQLPTGSIICFGIAVIYYFVNSAIVDGFCSLWSEFLSSVEEGERGFQFDFERRSETLINNDV